MVIPAGYAQVNMKFTGLAAPRGAQVTFGVENSTAKSPSLIAADVRDDWDGAGFDGIQVNTIVLSSVLVKAGPNDTGPSAEISTNIVGNLNGQNIAPQVAMLFRKATGTGGRKGSGRFFVPGLFEGDVDGSGNLTGNYITLGQTAASAFLTQLSGDSIPMVLLHADTLTPPTLVTALNVQAKIATQRRRLRK